MKLFDVRWNGAHGIGRFSIELRKRLSGFRDVDLAGRPSSAVDPWRLGMYLRRIRPELYLSPGYNAPSGCVCPFALTVHDLNHLCIRDNGGPLKRLYYSRILRPALRQALTVFTVSEFSRTQILEWSGLDESKLVAIRQGISDVFSVHAEKYVAERPYFLYVGNSKPHKNVKRMLTAYAGSGVAHDVDFMMTGRPTAELSDLLAKLNIGGVHFLGSVADGYLASLYRGALATVLVSVYEGFGLPIVESMACGTPVLTSNVTSMPEVAGDAAVLADPFDIDDIARKLRRIAEEDSLRDKLISRGLEWSTRYDWNDAARTIESALQRVMT